MPETGWRPATEPGHSAGAELATASTGTARWNIPGYARTLRLDAGLYAVILGKSETQAEDIAGITLPRTQIIPRIDDQAVVSILPVASGDQGWLGPDGGTVVLRVSEPGGFVYATTYGITAEAALPAIKLIDFNRLRDGLAPAVTVASNQQLREIPSELILHIERQGDRRFAGGGWAGNPGKRLRVEGFAIHPLETVAPGHIEYMAFAAGGRQTPWASDARLCGTRGRGLPLTGFAVRLAPALRDQFDVVYEGYFFESGVQGPARNGAPCVPFVADDPLAAIRLRVVERPRA